MVNLPIKRLNSPSRLVLVGLILSALAGVFFIAGQQSSARTVLHNFWEVPVLNKAFRADKHWDGADGAMSIELKPGVVLWLFGDTWVKHAKQRVMINNSVALQKSSTWKFYFKGSAARPLSMFRPSEKGVWYWPGDGAIYGDKLYLILKKIKKAKNPDPLFQFDWFGEDLVVVQNPFEPPQKWIYKSFPLPGHKGEVQYGIGCMKDKKFLYSLCFAPKTSRLKNRPSILARIEFEKLAKGNCKDWLFLCRLKDSRIATWDADFKRAINVVPDGGPEMSIFCHEEQNCFVIVYQPPLSSEIKMRVASKIEGPWSQSANLYYVNPIKLADGKKTALVYAGKAHKHLSSAKSLGITYCANPGGIPEHARNPEIYFPKAIGVHLEPSAVNRLISDVESKIEPESSAAPSSSVSSDSHQEAENKR